EVRGAELIVTEWLFLFEKQNVSIDLPAVSRDPLHHLVAFVKPVEVFADRFLARQIEDSRAHVLDKIGQIRIMAKQLRMLRGGFNIEQLALDFAIGIAPHQHRGGITKRLIVEVTAITERARLERSAEP